MDKEEGILKALLFLAKGIIMDNERPEAGRILAGISPNNCEFAWYMHEYRPHLPYKGDRFVIINGGMKYYCRCREEGVILCIFIYEKEENNKKEAAERYE